MAGVNWTLLVVVGSGRLWLGAVGGWGGHGDGVLVIVPRLLPDDARGQARPIIVALACTQVPDRSVTRLYLTEIAKAGTVSWTS